jgi:hypothetical protein
MSNAATTFLALAGSACAALSLASGEALRRDDGPFARRITPRQLLALVLLGLAVVEGAADGLRGRGSPALLALASALILAAGTGAMLWTFATGPRFRGDESLGERITWRGKIVLGVLLAALVVDLAAGGAVAELLKVRVPGSLVLALVALLLIALGTVATASTLHAGSPLLFASEQTPRRLSPLAKATAVLLGLALAAITLATILAPEVGLRLGQVLLALGVASGLYALVHNGTANAPPQPGLMGISSPGWLSLAFLGLAGVVVGIQAAVLLNRSERSLTATSARSGTGPQAPLGQPEKVDQRDWRWKPDSERSVDVTNPEAELARLRRQVSELQKEIRSLRAGPQGSPPELAREQSITPETLPPGSFVLDLSRWRPPLQTSRPNLRAVQ